jgi:site-specific recombinase XerD
MAVRLVESDSWLDRVGDSFERDLLRRDFSPATVRTYGLGIKNLFSFLRDQGVDDFHYLTRELLEAWQDSLRERTTPRPMKATSRGLYGTAVRQLIRWAADRDIVDLKLERAIVGVRTRKRDSSEARQPINAEDLEVIAAYLGPRRPRMSVIDLRDRAMFFFFVQTGGRVNEVLQVPRSSFIKARVRQKGGTYVDLEIKEGGIVAGMIDDYLRARTDDLPYLWISIGNNASSVRQLADSGVREAWRRLCLRLRIERFTTHQLRHTCATLIYENGGDELAIATWLHHADTRTAHRYTHVSDRKKQQTLDALETFVQLGTRPRLLPKAGRKSYGR